MSVSFYWCLCAITEDEYTTLKPKYAEADKCAKLQNSYKHAYQICVESPHSILPRFVPYKDLPEEKKADPRFKIGLIEDKLSDDFSLALDPGISKSIS